MAGDSPWRCWVCDADFGCETRFRQHVRHIHVGYRTEPTYIPHVSTCDGRADNGFGAIPGIGETMPKTELGTDEAAQAFDLLGHRRYVDVMAGVEQATRHAADKHGVTLPDDAIDEVKQFFAEEIAAADDRGDAFLDMLVEEMREPTEPPAQTSVGMAVGAKSSDHEALDKLTRVTIADNHRRHHDADQ